MLSNHDSSNKLKRNNEFNGTKILFPSLFLCYWYLIMYYSAAKIMTVIRGGARIRNCDGHYTAMIRILSYHAIMFNVLIIIIHFYFYKFFEVMVII